MSYYEIVMLVHPDHSDQIDEIIARQKATFEERGAKVHRSENWGRMRLAFSIGKKFKAHYIFFHIEADASAIGLFKEDVQYNTVILRYFVQKTDYIITDKSPLFRFPEDEDKPERQRQRVTAHPLEEFNYKNLRILKESMMETGRIVPARTTGRTAAQQRKVSRSIKIARYLALLPYCDRHK
ncbi:30S ribosomal protein S6 [Gammaproteobacteria bacterium]|nr:30S ribosomal protein S6 [Gammaproteobacteria bacterium]